MQGMVFLLPADQSATFLATECMPLKCFIARCKESFYDQDGDASNDEEASVSVGTLLLVDMADTAGQVARSNDKLYSW